MVHKKPTEAEIKAQFDKLSHVGNIKADGQGLRYDAGKNLLDLIPPEWKWALGMILTKGAAKYMKRNWERGMPWSKIHGPLERHLAKWQAGEDYDYGTPEEPGTNCHHLAIVAWNALALMSYQLRGIGENDLPEYDFSILAKVCDDANGIQPKSLEFTGVMRNEP